MVSESGLTGGHGFEPPLLYQFYGISPCAGIRSHMREGVKEHYMHIEPKSYKLLNF